MTMANIEGTDEEFFECANCGRAERAERIERETWLVLNLVEHGKWGGGPVGVIVACGRARCWAAATRELRSRASV